MFVAALLCQVILATAAFAVPTANERLARRVARRAAGVTHQSLPHQPVEFSENTVVSEVNGLDNATQAAVVYTNNWAGAVYSQKTATYKQVTGTFVVPTPKEPSGASGAHYASVWVGIDGGTCHTTFLQTGIDVMVNGSNVGYLAWSEWYPAQASYFEDITLKPGDTLTLTVEATSKTSGTASMKNHRTGKRVSHKFSGQSALCQHDAEWIVEDYTLKGLAPFADFGKVTFNDATAHTLAGKTVGPANAKHWDILKNNKAITKVTTGPKSVTVTYTGK
ncbi:acid proteinase [Ganoderma leucocontextum]|nr:acid proteinase [Ganoderma leucocontextum]